MLRTGHWVEEQRIEAGQQMRRLLVFSALAHVALVLALVLGPGPRPLRAPPALMVDLVAALPLAAPAPVAPAPPRKAPAEPAPAKPAPAPQPKVKILPKRAPAAEAKPRAKPRPKPEPVLRRRARPKELAYADALAQLRGEVGEPAPVAPSPAKAAPAPAAVEPAEVAAPSRGVRISPELLAWHVAVRRHVRAVWITPPEFRNRGLAAELVIDLDAQGRVRGRPELVRSSGNPFYDDNAIRALVKASPLPAPPEAGRRTVVFSPEE
ncbi:MAG: cell envelope integrity protein TolA [Myxococcota bacterium]|nr:cell envelope integrity protein TolA [Myxococcota bacterium]